MPAKRITRVEFPARTFSPKQPSPTKRVAAYARVSTMKDAQERYLFRFCPVGDRFCKHNPEPNV